MSALAYSHHFADHFAKESAAPIEFWRRRAEQGAKAIKSATFVAVDDGGFAGVGEGFLSEDGGTVEIGGMWVRPALRRSGIGLGLLGAVCEWARERGAGRARLWVRSGNDPARLLYERAGFAPAATPNDQGRTGMRLERIL